MKYLINSIKHLKTILIHKYWVFYISRKMGIGWQGFWHDMSKFHPTEFFESVKYYTGTNSPIDNCKKDNGYSLAWLHHKGCNKHHYEYWQDIKYDNFQPISMPDKYTIEMFCDYLAAGKAYNKDAFTFHKEYIWWQNKKQSILPMHSDQIFVIDHILEYCDFLFGNYDISDLYASEWKDIKNTLYTFLEIVKSI